MKERPPAAGVELQNFYEEVLHGYTYVDYEKRPAPQATDAINGRAAPGSGDLAQLSSTGGTGGPAPLMN